MDKENQYGIYHLDGTFTTQGDIRRKLLAERLQGGSEIIGRTAFADFMSFDDWSDALLQEQRTRHERLGIPEAIEVEIASTTPVPIALFGDVHAVHEDMDIEAFKKDINLTRRMGAYSLAFGDMTDSGFFMPPISEQLASNEEAVLYTQAALAALAEGDRLIAAWGGDHDNWSRDKMGTHALYQDFARRFHAHYLEGVSYVTVWINDGQRRIPYFIVGSHRHAGYSVYNDTHSSLRQFRDQGIITGCENFDNHFVLSISAHNHVKGHLRQTHKVFGGKELISHSITLGTYKKTDRWSRKKGWPRKGEQSIGAMGLLFYPSEQKVEVYWTLQEMADRLGY